MTTTTPPKPLKPGHEPIHVDNDGRVPGDSAAAISGLADLRDDEPADELPDRPAENGAGRPSPKTTGQASKASPRKRRGRQAPKRDPNTNRYGVFVKGVETVEVPMPKSWRSRARVELARGSNGRWYWGYAYGVREGGGSAAAARKGSGHGKRDEALLAGLRYLETRDCREDQSTKPAEARRFQKTVRAFREARFPDCSFCLQPRTKGSQTMATKTAAPKTKPAPTTTPAATNGHATPKKKKPAKKKATTKAAGGRKDSIFASTPDREETFEIDQMVDVFEVVPRGKVRACELVGRVIKTDGHYDTVVAVGLH